jgi:hypothetical protein
MVCSFYKAGEFFSAAMIQGDRQQAAVAAQPQQAAAHSV